MLHPLPSIIAPWGISDNYDHVSLNSLTTCWMTSSTWKVSSCIFFYLSAYLKIDADPTFDRSILRRDGSFVDTTKYFFFFFYLFRIEIKKYSKNLKIISIHVCLKDIFLNTFLSCFVQLLIKRLKSKKINKR